MAIAQVNGASNQSAVGVTTLSVTYSPTLGNTAVVFFMAGGAVTSLVVKDNLNNTLTAGPMSGNLAGFYQFPVPSGVTSYIATWLTSQQCSLAVEEYSGVGAVQSTFVIASGNSTTDTITVPIVAVNNWIVCGLGSANTLTATVGNSRQSTTTSTGRVNLMDNTSGVIGNVVCTATLTSAAWNAVGMEFGGVGLSVADQDLHLVITRPTNLSALVNQELQLVIQKPTNLSALVNQDFSFAVVSNPHLSVISQDLTLIIIRKSSLNNIPIIFISE